MDRALRSSIRAPPLPKLNGPGTEYTMRKVTNLGARDYWGAKVIEGHTFRTALREYRTKLIAAGAITDDPPAAINLPAANDAGINPPPADDAGINPSDYSSDYSSDDDGVAFALEARLAWTLRSDAVISKADARRRLQALSTRERDALQARADEFAMNPYLATKNRSLLLQFAALGEEWAEMLKETPTLADYLQAEAQTLDLEALLSEFD